MEESPAYTLQRVKYANNPDREFVSFFKGTTQPRRAVMVVHGHRGDSWQSIGLWGVPLADEGFLVIAPTLVGYASGTGERADFCGPKTVSDLTAVVAHIRNHYDLLALGLWGVSRGAISASLLAAKHPDWFQAIVLQAGAYDFKTFYEQTLPDIRTNIEQEIAPLNEDAFRERSSLESMGHVKAPVLVLHGLYDKNVPKEQAERLVDVLKANHVQHRAEFVDAKHYITEQTLQTSTIPFLREHILTR